MKEKWNVIEILRHSRHDWLNIMQLIKGNISLGKFDRVEEIIQEVISQTQNESKLSNLNTPRFATELLLFNWLKGKHFQLEFEVIGVSRNLEKNDLYLHGLFEQFTSILNEVCEPFGENHLQIIIKIIEEEYPSLTFDFQGKLINEEKFIHFSEKLNNDLCKVVEFHMNKEEVFLSLVLLDKND